MRNVSLHLARASEIALRFSGFIAIGLLVAACQTDPEAPKGAQTYKAALPPISDTVAPQRAVIRVGNDPAVAEITGPNQSVKITLQDPPKDTVVVGVWRAGVKFYDIKYVYEGSENLKYTNVTVGYPEARAILKRIYPSADHAAFVTEYAKLLVDNDSLVRSMGFPGKSIAGVDSAEVIRAALKYLTGKGLPLAAVVPKTGTWALGLDTGVVRTLLQDLLKDSTFKADTTKLFPPYPVRVKGAIALAAQLVSGGDAVGITGSFEATYKIVNLSSKVVRDGQDLTRNFEITPISFSEYPKTLDLSGKIDIRAKEGAAAGTYSLEVTVQDDSLRKATASVSFQVLPAADKIGPTIRFVQPPNDTALPNSVATLDVKVVVSDPSGVDSVWIDGKAAQKIDSLWVVTGIAIPVADLGYSVVVRARDAAKNYSNANILAVRKAAVDPGRPTLTVLQPKQGEEFDFDSSSILVRWKVEDPRGEVTKVSIGGAAATLDGANVWSRRVEIPSTGAPTTIALMAINAKNDTSTSFVQATRKLDAKGPSIEILSPPAGAGFNYEVASVSVQAKVTDPSGVDSVKINGVRIDAATGGDYLRSVDLAAGKITEISVEAWDKLSNKQVSTIKVSRKGPSDSTAPKIALLAPKVSGEVVSLATKTYTLKWLVTDVFGVADTGVRIDGTLASRSKDTFSLVVATPALGKVQSYRIDVVNLKGVTNFETVTLKRSADMEAPVILRVDSGKTVAFEIEKASVSWTITDNYKLGSVSINDKPVVGVDGLYSAEIALAFGSNAARLVAKDEAGNTKTDSVFVVRIWKDTSKPVIVREAGTETKNVGFDVTSLALGWKVADNAKVTVTINGVAAIANATGVYAYTLSLPGTVNGAKIVATDSSGNAQSDSVTISKSTDAVVPVLVRQAGTKDTAIPYAATTYAVAWKVTDNGSLASVEIDGKPATKIGDIYSLEVTGLSVGKKVIRIKAVDAFTNTAWDSITVQRGYHDSIAPTVVRADSATTTKTVQYARDTVTVSWTVTDNDAIKSVTLNGMAISKIGGVYSKKLTLAVGANVVTLAVLDTANNFKGDTLTITRAAKDVLAPTITAGIGASDRDVSYDTTSTKLNWTVTDAGGVKEVTVNGIAISAVSAGAYQFAATGLAVGANKFVIVAKDAENNEAFLTVTITRAWKDLIAPQITRGAGTGAREVVFDSAAITMTWTVADTMLSEVRIQDSLTASSTSAYTRKVGLAIGANLIKITAKDLAGNLSMDTFTVTRKVGASPVLTISHPEGAYDSILHVRVASSVAGATIRYTIDGTEPTASSLVYTSGTITIDQSRTLKVNAIAEGRTQSATAVRAYRLVVPGVTFSRLSGFETDVNFGVKLACTLAGAKIYYTTDGSTPNATSSAWYSGDSVVIDSIRTLKAIAVKTGWTTSTTASAAFRANVPVKIVTTGGGFGVIRADGSLWTTGNMLLDGTNNTSAVFAKVMESVKDVTRNHILTSNGNVYGFGFNANGQVGNGESSWDNIYSPVFIKSGIAKIAGYSGTAFLLDQNGTLWASGNNYSGQYCNSSTLDSYEFISVQTGVIDIGAGENYTYFRNSAGDVYSCGSGPLGNGINQSYRQKVPSKVVGGTGKPIIGRGGQFGHVAFLLTATGDVYGTGGNLYGVLGQGEVSGPSQSDSTFVKVGTNVIQVSSAAGTTFFLDRSGDLYGAGYNWYGGLGDGTSSNSNPTMRRLHTNVKFVETFGSLTYIIKNDGTLWAMGSNDGMYGDGSTEASLSPKQIHVQVY